MPPPESPAISVVIPHLNTPAQLRRCLAALSGQTPGSAPCEIIVVDNGSRELPADVCAAFPDVRLACEPEPGPGPARNRGAALARGEIIAFIDADCFAEPDLLAEIGRHFRSCPDCGCIAGRLRVAPGRPGRLTALEAYDAVYSHRARLYAERDHYADTGNMSVRRHVFQAVGPFKGILTMEDKEWGQRAFEQGVRMDYVPTAVVRTPASGSFAELAQRWNRHIGHEFEEVPPGAGGRTRWLMRAVAVAVSPIYEAVRLLVGSGEDLSLSERMSLLPCLVRIRLYRARKMISLVRAETAGDMIRSWNRS